MKARHILTAAVLILAAAGAAKADVFADEAAFLSAIGPDHVLIDFDTDMAGNPIPSGTVIDTQYSAYGVTFGPFAGGNPATYEDQWSRLDSLPNYVYTVIPWTGGGGFQATFSRPVQSFGLWVLDVQPSYGATTLRALNAQDEEVAFFNLGDYVAIPPFWQFFGFTTESPMSTVQIEIGAADGVGFDRMFVVPEPATLSLLALGFGAFFVRRRRRA